jgi:hypothetical protein
MRSLLLVAPFLASMIALPGCASAQPARDSAHLRNHCRLAIQVIATGVPAPHHEWAYETAIYCGTAGGAAIAQAILRSREGNDLTALDMITRPVRQLTDATVLRAALSVAGDASATPAARVFSFRALINLLSPGRVLTYSQLAGTSDDRSCFGLGPSLHSERLLGEPLPADASRAIRELATGVAADEQAEPEVRRAATCAAYFAR